MQYRRFAAALLLPALLASTGCYSGVSRTPAIHDSKPAIKRNDACKSAVRHYEAEDIPDSEIVKMFERMAQDGDVRGTMWLARLYDLGRCSLPQSPDVARQMAKSVIAQVMALAENNDVEAEFLLGSAYQRGIGVDRNFEKAVRWYTRAVDGGQITAMNNLAVMLARGHGTEPDIDKARLLFSRAAETGSKLASENLVTYGAANPDRTKRMQSLRATLLIQTLGMQKDEGVAFLAKNGLISDPKASDESDRHERHQYLFKADGLMLDVDLNGRIMEVEGYDRGAHGSEQRFRGELPLGLTWDTRARSALQTLGDPYDQGYVKWDEAYGLAYRIDNVIFVALFSYEGESGLKVMRVYERWATKYPPPQLPDHGK